MQLDSVTYYPGSNTLEAAWVEPVLNSEGEVVSYSRVKCRSYSADQVAEFQADVGADAGRYTTMAGW